MRLLIVTQVVDRMHPELGFFHSWIEELAGRFDRIEVICLYVGDYMLPDNVRVYSLGKEGQREGASQNAFSSRVRYAARFIRLVWLLRPRYDAVFVHMNEEYVLLAGILWKLLGKRTYMWRNHYAGSFRTDIAVAFCTKVFCTSRYSYTAKYEKTVLMPVGVDTARFFPDRNTPRKENSILFLARMAPSKDPLMLLNALRILKERQVPFTATFVGSPLPEHKAYYCSLVKRTEQYQLMESVSFLQRATRDQTPVIYRSHEIFVNCSPSGMFDKTIFEAAACGCLVLAASADFQEQVGSNLSFSTYEELAARLEALLSDGGRERGKDFEKMQAIVSANDLQSLMTRLASEVRS